MRCIRTTTSSSYLSIRCPVWAALQTHLLQYPKPNQQVQQQPDQNIESINPGPIRQAPKTQRQHARVAYKSHKVPHSNQPRKRAQESATTWIDSCTGRRCTVSRTAATAIRQTTTTSERKKMRVGRKVDAMYCALPAQGIKSKQVRYHIMSPRNPAMPSLCTRCKPRSEHHPNQRMKITRSEVMDTEISRRTPNDRAIPIPEQTWCHQTALPGAVRSSVVPPSIIVPEFQKSTEPSGMW